MTAGREAFDLFHPVCRYHFRKYFAKRWSDIGWWKLVYSDTINRVCTKRPQAMKTAIEQVREYMEHKPHCMMIHPDGHRCDCGYDAALTSLKSLEGQGWISVDERLPIKEKWVIVIADGAMNCAWYDEQRGWHNGFNERPRNIRIEDITHWQPLPSAPALTKSANP